MNADWLDLTMSSSMTSTLLNPFCDTVYEPADWLSWDLFPLGPAPLPQAQAADPMPQELAPAADPVPQELAQAADPMPQELAQAADPVAQELAQVDTGEITCSLKDLPLSERPSRDQKRKRVSKKATARAKLGDGARDLIELDSKEIDDHIRKLRGLKVLSGSEENDLRRIRRSIKNRGYAQASRDRQKKQLEARRKRCKTLEAEKSAMETRALQAERANTKLAAQLQLLIEGTQA